MGQLGVGDERPDLQQQADGQVPEVDMGERVHLGPVAGQQRKGQVEDEQEDEHGGHAQTDLTADEGPPVPPAAVGSGRAGILGGHHPPHNYTPPGSNLTCWLRGGPGGQEDGNRPRPGGRRQWRRPKGGHARPSRIGAGEPGDGPPASHRGERDGLRTPRPRDRTRRATTRPALRGGVGQGRPVTHHPRRGRRGHHHLGPLPAHRPAQRSDPLDLHRRLPRPGAQPGGQFPPAAPLSPRVGHRPRVRRRRAGIHRPARVVRLSLGELAHPRGQEPAQHGPATPEGPWLAGPHSAALPPAVVGAEEPRPSCNRRPAT